MADLSHLGNPYDASNSWNGFNHQGKIALWFAIQFLTNLWDSAVDNHKVFEEYFLELEYEEDFSIGKYSQDGHIYLSIHQVKARLDNSICDYKDAVLELLAKVIDQDTIQAAYLHVSQDLHLSEMELQKKVGDFLCSPDPLATEIASKRSDSTFREVLCTSKGRPTKLKKAVMRALQEKTGTKSDLSEKNLDDAFDAYLERCRSLQKSSQTQREKLHIFEYPDLPQKGVKQGYCVLNQAPELLKNAIFAYYQKTNPTQWRYLDQTYIQKMYLFLLGRLDAHLIDRHLYRSAYKMGPLDRTIPLSTIADWLAEDIDKFGESYYLYYLKNELTQAIEEYCYECKRCPKHCTQCHIKDAQKKIGAMPPEQFKEFLHTISPHVCGSIKMETYARYADIYGFQNPFSMALREIGVPFMLDEEILPIAYVDQAQRVHVLTTIYCPAIDGGTCKVCTSIVKNPDVYNLLMDCDALISKDVSSTSIWEDSDRITDVSENPKMTEHIAHCKNIRIVPLDSCIDYFVEKGEQI